VVAGGSEKCKSIKGALNSSIVTTLIVDENTAKKVLEN
jgi:DNA-binding transcriptional regulator LsrR (DeoR family)